MSTTAPASTAAIASSRRSASEKPKTRIPLVLPCSRLCGSPGWEGGALKAGDGDCQLSVFTLLCWGRMLDVRIVPIVTTALISGVDRLTRGCRPL
jgi:hypothetical protein